MKDIIINIKNVTRKATVSTDILGVVGENLQGNFIVDFTDEFVDGMCALEFQLPDGTCGYILMNKDVGKKMYSVPVKSSLLNKAGTVALQLKITQNGESDEVPIFKSNIFKLLVDESINAEVEKPDEYAEWIDIANSKLAEIDERIAELQKIYDEIRRENINK